MDTDSRWPARIAALLGVGIFAVAGYAVLAIATGEGAEEPLRPGTERSHLVKGRDLLEKERYGRAARVLRKAVRRLPDGAPQRVRATANFAYGVALRGSGRFERAEKPLKRSRRLGISPATVGRELAKARSGIRD